MSQVDLLRAILIDPYDDTPRLIYADWLEENGNEERAKAIRSAIEHGHVCFKTNSEWIYRRGFLEEIKLNMDLFLREVEHQKSLFRRHPITKVTITDKQPRNWIARDPPHPPINCSRWWSALEISPEILDISLASDALPTKVFFELRNQLGHMSYPTEAMLYRTDADAMEDLSQACVAYARQLVGLPPLKISPITDAARS